MEEKTIRDGAHGVLSDAKIQLPTFERKCLAFVVWMTDYPRRFNQCPIGPSQICRTTN